MADERTYRVLITGASGFAGRAVLELCLPDEARYREITYDYTMESRRWLKERSPGSAESRYTMEKLLRPLEFLYRPFKNLSIRTDDFGQAMIQATVEGLTDGILENCDLRELAERYTAVS